MTYHSYHHLPTPVMKNVLDGSPIPKRQQMTNRHQYPVLVTIKYLLSIPMFDNLTAASMFVLLVYLTLNPGLKCGLFGLISRSKCTGTRRRRGALPGHRKHRAWWGGTQDPKKPPTVYPLSQRAIPPPPIAGYSEYLA